MIKDREKVKKSEEEIERPTRPVVEREMTSEGRKESDG